MLNISRILADSQSVPPVTTPIATQPVATTSVATPPVATQPIAILPVATPPCLDTQTSWRGVSHSSKCLTGNFNVMFKILNLSRNGIDHQEHEVLSRRGSLATE